MTELILLEDEPVLAVELDEFLRECGYQVTMTNSLASFVAAFDEQRHRLAVLDLGLPDGDGLELIGQLRERGSTLGIVAFTARSATAHRVSGFRQGADHYLAKAAIWTSWPRYSKPCAGVSACCHSRRPPGSSGLARGSCRRPTSRTCAFRTRTSWCCTA